MNREMLKDLGLEEEAINKIMAENGKDIENAKGDLKAKESELQKVQEQLKEANKTIESYKDMNIEDIKKSAEDWEGKAKELETELTQTRNEALLDKNLAAINTYDPDMLKKALNQEEIIFKDGEIIGLDKQIESLKESKAYLFKAEAPAEPEQPSIQGVKSYEPGTSGASGATGMQAEIEAVFNN